MIWQGETIFDLNVDFVRAAVAKKALLQFFTCVMVLRNQYMIFRAAFTILYRIHMRFTSHGDMPLNVCPQQPPCPAAVVSLSLNQHV